MQNKVIIITLAFLLMLMVGYSLFGESININGTAKASGKFDIIFNSVGDPVIHGGASITKAEIIEPDKTALKIENVVLDYPTSYVEIPVTIKNIGSIDAYIKGIKVAGLDTTDIKVTYTDLKENQILKINEERSFKLRIAWDKESVSQVPKLDFSIEIDYEQITEDLPPQRTYEVGEEFCLDTECFYVIEDNGSMVTALAKYNLLVGNIATVAAPGSETIVSTIPISKDEEGYGLQNVSSQGSNPTMTTFIGVLPFSNETYWLNEKNSLLPQYGSSYPAYVFDKNSNLYEYVKNYEIYLKDNLKKKSASVRLIKYDELVKLGCKKEGGARACLSAPSWVYATTYWGATASTANYITHVNTKAHFNSGYDFNYAYSRGIRPVITISKSEI